MGWLSDLADLCTPFKDVDRFLFGDPPQRRDPPPAGLPRRAGVYVRQTSPPKQRKQPWNIGRNDVYLDRGER